MQLYGWQRTGPKLRRLLKLWKCGTIAQTIDRAADECLARERKKQQRKKQGDKND